MGDSHLELSGHPNFIGREALNCEEIQSNPFILNMKNHL